MSLPRALVQIPGDFSPTNLFQQIDFDINNREIDWFERLAFWESLRPWFSQQGYTLYCVNREWNGEYTSNASSCSPQHTFEGDVHHPYAVSGGDPEDTKNHPLYAWLHERVVFAQDRENRHVVIKLIENESHEYKILRFLSKQSILYSLDSFPCVIPPVDFLLFDGHWFVVMPRWGDTVLIPEFSTIGEVVEHIYCLCKGMAFLHENMIVHRDVGYGNILINHFAQALGYRNNVMRKTLRKERRLLYAWFDFDLAIMFSNSTPPEKRRLPWYEIAVGSFFSPSDTAQGELDYDPFACDVGSLGRWLSVEFQHLTTQIPMLAPILDRMVDFNPKTRYTASQILQLFEELRTSSIPSECLDLPLLPMPAIEDKKYPEEYDRWAGLPPAYTTAWSKYRLNQMVPWSMKILRYICRYRWGFWLVHGMRHAFHALTCSPLAQSSPFP